KLRQRKRAIDERKFSPKAGQRWNACQTEHERCNDQGYDWVCSIEPSKLIERIDLTFATAQINQCRKRAQCGEHVHAQKEHRRTKSVDACSLRSACCGNRAWLRCSIFAGRGRNCICRG